MSVASDCTAWQEHSQRLAKWALDRLVNRSDRHGCYGDKGAFTADTLDEYTLRNHFYGAKVVGLHSTAADNTCKWLGLDIDNHDGDDNLAADNLSTAIELLNKLLDLGIMAALEDSNGDGGYHIWILFSEPVPTEDVFRFAKWLIDGADIETSPKQAALSGKGLGNWLRLPGRHHTREHWSRVWGDGEWLDDAESVEALLNLPANDPSVLNVVPDEPPDNDACEPATRKTMEKRQQPLPDVNGTESLVDIAERTIEQTPWRELLESQGWHLESNNGAESTWTRPGKESGVSATLNFGGNNLFHVFTESTNLPADGKSNGQSYGKWRFYCWSHNFGTDQVAAAKEYLPDDVVQEHGQQWRESQSGAAHSNDEQPTESPKKTFEGKDISDLEPHAESEVDWLVDGIFSSDQPTLFGAKSKCLKTTLLVDLTIALATGGKWLGAFQVGKPRRVLFFTGEANYRAVARRLKKACKSHGTSFSALRGMLRVDAMEFPKLPNVTHCVAVADAVKKYDIDVVIVDPLYRGMTAQMDTNRMADIGDAIVNFANWCRPASLVMSHHTTKASARELGSPPDLEDMTGAGIAESFGNWWLMGRNEKYQWDWNHDLCVQFGGRDEQAGGRRILFNEKDWTAEVSNLHEFLTEQQEAAQKAREDAKREKHHRAIETARSRVQNVLRDQTTPLSKNQIEERRGEVPQKEIRQAIYDMETDQSLTIHDYRDSRNRLQSGGYLLAEKGHEYDALFSESEDVR
ncbi:AAA family ATPase [Fuerstiella marisgermanici]|uniref:TOTE conflict system primase domain-containing protein n=1 Tax=Fuerstiella marisgermanici TaxID=1891926 RepID=A0A1P8W8Z2_9PLAN|nr:AAA family ATPase [Fuerstiella marisgermanici]APZ90532.1 hypothetical protein Fuma_00111 [Fuerstiella marisgermanici]